MINPNQTIDSLTQIINTLHHTLDSLSHNQIINNNQINIPGKSTFEIVLLILVPILSFITVFINIILNKRQLQNAYSVVRVSNRMNAELKELEQFKESRKEIIKLLDECYDLRYRFAGEDKIKLIIDKIYKIYRPLQEYLNKINAQGTEATIASFTHLVKSEYKKNYFVVDLETKISKDYTTFVNITADIITKETERIYS